MDKPPLKESFWHNSATKNMVLPTEVEKRE